MIHHNSVLFMTFLKQKINLIKDELTAFYWLQVILISIFERIKKMFYNVLKCCIINRDFMLSLFKCITCTSLLSTEEIKLIAIVSWIFYVSDILRLFMISFIYGLLWLRYSSADSVLFLSPLLSHSIWLLLQKLLALTGLE